MTRNLDYIYNMQKEKLDSLQSELQAFKGEHDWFNRKMNQLEDKTEQILNTLNNLVIEIRGMQKDLQYSMKSMQQLEEEVKSFKKAVKEKFEEHDLKLINFDKFQVKVITYATVASLLIGYLKDQII